MVYNMNTHTDSTGTEIKVGDTVTVKGSKIVRVVAAINDNTVYPERSIQALRQDGKDAAWSTWSKPANLTIIR